MPPYSILAAVVLAIVTGLMPLAAEPARVEAADAGSDSRQTAPSGAAADSAAAPQANSRRAARPRRQAAPAEVNGQPPAGGSNETLPPSESSDETDPPPGHSYHGEAFNEGPRQAAYLMGGTGPVHLSISTAAPQAQAFFDQGVGQLHGFWYFEAERSFRQVLQLDPDCAMAYWGMTMANVNNESRAAKFIAEAVARKDRATRREQLWIEAWNKYYQAGSKQDKERRRRLVRDLETIVHEFPDELEAKAFLAVQIWLNSSRGWPIASHEAVDSLIERIFQVEPMHPAHHYRIHLWDNEKAARALASAALCGQSSPAIAHMWHMPGHIFSKLQRYNDAVWQQEASGRVDHAHMIRDRIMPDQIHNYAHNQEWLIRNLNHVGRVHDAVELAKNLVELPRHPRFNTLAKRGSAQFGRTRLFETLLRYELWDELIALADTPYLEPTDQPREQVRRLRALGTAWFGKHDVEQGQQYLAQLETLLAKEQQARDDAVAAAETKAREDNKPDADVKKAGEAAGNPFKNQLQAIESALAELRGHLLLAQGDHSAALAQLAKADAVAKEVLSRVHLAAGDKAKAEQTARDAVRTGARQVVPLANLAWVLDQCGKQDEARRTFDDLRRLAYEADLDVPPLARLAPLAARQGLSADWRADRELPGDIGDRPALESLGPYRWQPAPAPPWKLTDAGGQGRSLAQYRGRPVVVIFYLGFGCLHCVEQLKTFGPMAGQFADEGIELLAVSSDAPDVLKQSLDQFQSDGQFALPLVSDQPLDVFRAYRCYDDFEQQPLHGTFLIDGDGLIRWQDISYEPFSDARFVLDEARRLLHFSTARRLTARP